MSGVDDLRGLALAVRDLCEMSGASECALTFDGSTLVFSPDDGCHLIEDPGDPFGEVVHNLTGWVDYTGAVIA